MQSGGELFTVGADAAVTTALTCATCECRLRQSPHWLAGLELNSFLGESGYAIEEVAEGTTFESPRGMGTLTGRHVAQTIYLADGTGGSFEVINSFDNVPSSEGCN